MQKGANMKKLIVVLIVVMVGVAFANPGVIEKIQDRLARIESVLDRIEKAIKPPKEKPRCPAAGEVAGVVECICCGRVGPKQYYADHSCDFKCPKCGGTIERKRQVIERPPNKYFNYTRGMRWTYYQCTKCKYNLPF